MNMARRPPPSVPPDKGSFPLDHFAECKEAMEAFMACLKANNYNQRVCRQESRDYLQCRMDNDLMAKEDMDILGFANIQPTKDKT